MRPFFLYNVSVELFFEDSTFVGIIFTQLILYGYSALSGLCVGDLSDILKRYYPCGALFL